MRGDVVCIGHLFSCRPILELVAYTVGVEDGEESFQGDVEQQGAEGASLLDADVEFDVAGKSLLTLDALGAACLIIG